MFDHLLRRLGAWLSTLLRRRGAVPVPAPELPRFDRLRGCP
jgi:hypothetical protein